MGLASRNILSGFVLTGLQAIMSLLVVRGYVLNLEKATYGICMAVAQVTALMAFLDLGIGPALARYVVDYRRTMSNVEFGGMLKTVLRIGMAQSAICMALMGFGAGAMADILKLSPESRPLFVQMIWLVSIPTSLSFLARPFGQLLYATGRIYTVNVLSLGSAIVQAVIVLFGLYHGWGPYSVVAGQWLYVICFQGAMVALVIRSGYVPSLRVPAAPVRQMRPLLFFSRDVFIATFGRQLLQFAPTLLISRLFGEARLGDWHAGTRMLYLASQIVSRVPAGVEPLLWRMFSHGEVDQLRGRLKETIQATAAVCCFLGAGLVMANSAFVHAWTAGRVAWSPALDVLSVLWIFVVSLELGGGTLLGVTKRVGLAHVVYYSEMAVLYVLSSLQALRAWGFGAALLSLSLAHASFTLAYHTARMKIDLGFHGKQLAAIYVRPVASFVVLSALSWMVACWVREMGVIRAAVAIAIVQLAVVAPTVWFGLVPARHRHGAIDAARRLVRWPVSPRAS